MVITAIPVGFVAGLFGIGGGLITVPFLYYIFGSLGINPDFLMHLAVGTSFAIIIPTSTVTVLTHHKFKAVDFDVVKSYGIFVIFGVVLGTIFASPVSSATLRFPTRPQYGFGTGTRDQANQLFLHPHARLSK